jgi:hypothetical protein
MPSGGGELDVQVGGAGAAGIAAGQDLGARDNLLANFDVGGDAVAVGPAVAVDAQHGDADAAGVAFPRGSRRSRGPTSCAANIAR